MRVASIDARHSGKLPTFQSETSHSLQSVEISYIWRMPQDLKTIVERRLAQLGLGPVEAAVAGGLERTYIRDITEGKKRSIRADKLRRLAAALKLDAAALSENELVPLDLETPPSMPKLTAVPFLGNVSAGGLALSEVPLEVSDFVDVAGLPEGDWIALRVDGTSMDRVSPPESIIFVNRKERVLVPNGYYVVANGDGASTYKKYKTNPSRFEPESTQQHDPIFPTQPPKVIGRVRLSLLRI